ncbi:tubby-related protein 1 [Entomortierella parvispora]|uniref:Tubby-related protein 1 n=1 Tax=Entomortierella parvispora TaxID=205924 RepID=A0A9P3H8P1_9FUNG|nr:tubby-related protein 1 [Entomortierella parvispora]
MAHHPQQRNAHAYPSGGTSASAFSHHHHPDASSHGHNHGDSLNSDYQPHTPPNPTAAARQDSSNLDDEDTGAGQPEALINPAPSPLPEPYIINQPTAHNTPQFSFGPQLDLMTPKLLHDTLMSPVPQGKKFMCVIVRKNEGMDRRLYPTYELSLEDPERPRSVFLLRAAKKKRSRGSYYAITSESAESMNPNGTSPGSGGASSNDFHDRKATDTQYGVLGKLRSNFLGTAFNVYSNGRNPFSGSGGGGVDSSHQRHHDFEEDGNLNEEKEGNHVPVRQELGAVIYNPNVLGLKGPRKMTILMNTMTIDGEMAERRPTLVKDTLIGRMTDGDMSDLLVLRNKSPQWNDDTNSFVLNFGGRVTLASVKNFQIVHDNDLDYIIMQFGRTSQDTFTMDCQYPMTPFQAFAFALTSFDAKLACE